MLACKSCGVFLRAAMLIEGLRLDGPQRIGGLILEPMGHHFAGRDLREPLNEMLAARGFVSEFEAPIWAAQLGPRRRLALVLTPPLEADDVVTASQYASIVLRQLVDALTLTHGGAPRVFAAVHERSDHGEQWSMFAVMVGAGAFPGTVLARILPDGETLPPVGAQLAWTRAQSDPLVALWLSLYSGIAGEPRWDVKILRCCSLLEAIARERLPAESPVTDENGDPLSGYDGTPATTRSLRGKLYLLAASAIGSAIQSERPLLSHPSRTLWEEAGIWADVRNLVAHEGMWNPPPVPSTLGAQQARSAAAFEVAGRGDGVDAGSARYADAVSAAAEAVLRSLVLAAAPEPTRRDDGGAR